MTPGIFEHDGIRFTFEIAGNGQPVVLLHGLGGNRAQSLGLAPEGPWQRVAIELRGHGDTEPVGPSEAFSFPQFAQDLTAFLDHMGIDRSVVGGVSMGAGVALRYALDHPGRVRALILVRPAWLHESLVESQPVWDELARLLESVGAKEAERAFRASPRYAETSRVSRYAAESLCHQFGDRDAVARRARLVGMPRSTPYDDPSDLARIDVPALVVGAKRDPQHPWEFAEIWAVGIPDSRLVEVTSKAVDPDQHHREVQQAVGTFLREVLTDSQGDVGA